MGTERWQIHSSACPCGKGRLVVDHCETDHPWSFKTWLEPSIECETCEKEYALTTEGRRVILVKRAAVENQKRLKAQAYELSVALKKSGAAAPIIAKAVEAVEKLPSKAAVHRVLDGVVWTGGIAGFRKSLDRAGGAGKWLRGAISAHNLPAVMKWLKVTNAEVETQLARIHALEREADKAFPESKVIYERPLS